MKYTERILCHLYFQPVTIFLGDIIGALTSSGDYRDALQFCIIGRPLAAIICNAKKASTLQYQIVGVELKV